MCAEAWLWVPEGTEGVGGRVGDRPARRESIGEPTRDGGRSPSRSAPPVTVAGISTPSRPGPCVARVGQWPGDCTLVRGLPCGVACWLAALEPSR